MKNTSILFYSHHWSNHDERIASLSDGLSMGADSFGAEYTTNFFVELMTLTEFIHEHITLASMTYEIIIKNKMCHEILVMMAFDFSKLRLKFSLDNPEVYTCEYEASNKTRHPFIITGPTSMAKYGEIKSWALHFIFNEKHRQTQLSELDEYDKIIRKVEQLKALYMDFDITVADDHRQLFIDTRDDVVEALNTAHGMLRYY